MLADDPIINMEYVVRIHEFYLCTYLEIGTEAELVYSNKRTSRAIVVLL